MPIHFNVMIAKEIPGREDCKAAIQSFAFFHHAATERVKRLA
jgi:hypothetical protein